jgi:hypothetical protein
MFYVDTISFCTTVHPNYSVMFSIFSKRSYYIFSMLVSIQRSVLFFASAIHCPDGSSRFLTFLKLFFLRCSPESVEESNCINDVLGCFLFLCSCICTYDQ